MTGYQSKKAAAQDKLAQPEQEPVGGTREAFENWAKSLPNYIDITRFENGYSDCNTDYAWAAWQAALAQEKSKDAMKLARLAISNLIASSHATDPQHWRDARQDAVTALAAIDKALAEQPPQPAQEPWRESASDYERGFIDGRQKQAQSSVDKAVNRMAQRPWVGLSSVDFNDFNPLFTAEEAARWADAKLQEKNNG